MPTHTFALVVTTVADAPTTGPVTGILGADATALMTRLSSYGEAMSGGRVELATRMTAAQKRREQGRGHERVLEAGAFGGEALENRRVHWSRPRGRGWTRLSRTCHSFRLMQVAQSQ